MNKSLSEIYDTIKSEVDSPKIENPMMKIKMNGNIDNSPGAAAYRQKTIQECDKLKQECGKKILLDIYCRVIPLDSDYVSGNQGVMKSDIDKFLKNKDMTSMQYLTSAYEKTKAPLLEFILRSCDGIGKQFVEETTEVLKDANENEISVPPPVADADSEDTENQLVDITNDTEYETFIDTLKKKTIDKIVDDVSKIISDEKEDKGMEFDLKPDAVTESTVTVVLDYMNKGLWKENVEINPQTFEEMIGIAIRESTLNLLDLTFNQPDAEIKQFSTKIRFGKGVLVNESTIQYLKESSN